jgi:hypothetical protein
MNSTSFLFLGLTLAAPGGTAKADDLPDIPEMQRVVGRSLPFLRREGLAWIEERKCVSCHQVPFMLWGLEVAHSRGIAGQRDGLDRWTRWSLEQTLAQADTPKRKEFAQKNADTIAELILARGYGEKEIPTYEALGALLLDGQQPDGSWKPGGQLPSQRRPQREIAQVSTLWALLALRSLEEVGHPRSKEIAAARQRALAWLGDPGPGKSNELLVVRLLAEKEFGKKAKARELLAELLGRQRADGGWGWLRDGPSDAFATGQALFALGRMLPTDHAAVRKAWRYLRDTQGEDGSWPVPSTKASRKGRPIPTSIYWGTGWAVIGLASTMPK